MPKFTLSTGDVVEFTPFALNDDHLGKLLLHDDNKDREGPWCYFSPEDWKKYNDPTCSDWGVACLANDALMFYPTRSWGMYIPIRFRGSERPEFNFAWMEGNDDPLQYHEDARRRMETDGKVVHPNEIIQGRRATPEELAELKGDTDVSDTNDR